MNFFSKVVWKIVEMLHFVFGFQIVDFIKRKKTSTIKKIYMIILLIIIIAYTIYFFVKKTNLTSMSYIEFIYSLIFAVESGMAIISILTEISISFCKNNHIDQNIYAIDEHMKLSKDTKLKFNLTLTIFCLFYIFFMAQAIILDAVENGFDTIFILMTLKSKVFDMAFLKFVMIVNLNLCRLCIMNDHLMIKLKSKRNYGKSNWLFDWRLYPKNIEIFHRIENLNDFSFMYSNLCENMAFISKKFEPFVSRNSNRVNRYVWLNLIFCFS